MFMDMVVGDLLEGHIPLSPSPSSAWVLPTEPRNVGHMWERTWGQPAAKGHSAGMLQARECQWMGRGVKEGLWDQEGPGGSKSDPVCHTASPATVWVLGMSSLPRAELVEKETVHPCSGAQH